MGREQQEFGHTLSAVGEHLIAEEIEEAVAGAFAGIGECNRLDERRASLMPTCV